MSEDSEHSFLDFCLVCLVFPPSVTILSRIVSRSSRRDRSGICSRGPGTGTGDTELDLTVEGINRGLGGRGDDT